MKLQAKDKRYVAALLAVLLLGGVFYFGGAMWGLPARLHPDEWSIVTPAIQMIKDHTFEPSVFFRPDHLLIMINMLIYKALTYVVGMSIEAIEAGHLHWLYFISRVITGCFGLGCAVLSYLVCSRIHKAAGLAAAFLFACYPLMVLNGHYVTPDVPIVFFMLLLILFAMKYMEQPDYKRLIILCLITALFITIKYTGAILCVFIAIVVIYTSVRDKDYWRILKQGALAVFLCLFFIFLISPVLFTNFPAVREAFLREARTTHLGADGLGVFGNLLFYCRTFVDYGGILLIPFMVIGIYYLAGKSRKTVKGQYLPIFFSFIYWIILSCVALHWDRWALPMYVSPLLLSALGIWYSLVWVRQGKMKKWRRKASGIIACIAVGLVALNLLTGSTVSLLKHMATDTRVTSKTYCDENDITEENAVFEGYTPLMQGGMKNIFDEFDETAGYKPKDPAKKYIVLSSDAYGRYFAEPEKYEKQIACYQAIFDHYELQAKFDSVKSKTSCIDVVNIFYNIQYFVELGKNPAIGPDILIYRVQQL